MTHRFTDYKLCMLDKSIFMFALDLSFNFKNRFNKKIIRKFKNCFARKQTSYAMQFRKRMFPLLERDHISNEILYVSLSLSPNSRTYCTQNFWNLFICCVIDSYCCSSETWGRYWLPIVCQERICFKWKAVCLSEPIEKSPGIYVLAKL